MTNEEAKTKKVICPYCGGENIVEEYSFGRLIIKQKIRCQHCFEVFWDWSDEE